VSAVTSGLATRSGTLALVLLPLATPVVIAAAAATRLAGAGELASHGRMWLELLAVAALVFLTLGMMIFEHALEE
jgi:ABC-type transport system involved in cytochrome c biogenesis permease component